ncbi:U32 family peptidase [Oscillibacter valericigenes]|nr:U32 family peptidase [Oscillibacter valericigenes]
MAELLSPAGGREALIAAVQSGADAVYMGFGSFNARRSARNFSDEEFLAAVRYCHLRGVRVYLTLNTLVTDRELPALAETARRASEYGVDAILVQDWGVYETLRAVIPDVPLHASTQMALHTLSGVEEAARLGMTRAVLARELSREDIRDIVAGAPIEVETFAHGALCMCYSGMCEMSAVIGGRSGNRGACAQPCRLRYGWHGKADGNPLSLRDANLAAYADEMAEMGVACLKLEGRMKRPEYVAAVTGIYAALLREHRAPTADEQKKLALAFSRDGFTDGYYRGARGKEMFGVRPEDARWPEEWFGELRAAYEREDLRLVPVRLRAEIRAGVPMTLTAEDADGHTVTAAGAVPEAARNRALTAEEVEARLRKTGGTAFTVSDCAVALEDGLSVSASALNALRREALAALEAVRTALPERREGAFVPSGRIKNPTEPPRLTVSIYRPGQLTDALVHEGVETVYVPLELIEAVDVEKYRGQTNFAAVLPRVWRTADEAALREQLRAARERGVETAVLGNLGHFALVRGMGFALRGDFGLNVFNSAALRFLKEQGLESATLSFELRHEQLRDIAKCIPCEAIVYGRLPLMITENCIVANEFGCRYGKGRCDAAHADSACAAAPELTDRVGERFPVLHAYGCRSELQNGKVLWLADKPEYRKIGLTYARLRFTTESPEECLRVLRAYKGREDYAPKDLTRGLFYRGVE